MDELNISQHAKERYAERIMGKENKIEISEYVAQNEEKIKKDISKMIEFGSIIYSGKSTNVNNKGEVNVYIKDTWIIIVGKTNNNVITLFSIDLGLGKEFNKEYINKMIDKLEKEKNYLSNVINQVQEQTDIYKNLINENLDYIEESRKTIKALENQNNAYRELINSINADIIVAENNVRKTIATLIGKKGF